MIRQRQVRFESNRKRLSKGLKMKFPAEASQPRALRDIFTTFKQVIKPEDLIRLSRGEEVTEGLINLYFKILEKINFTLL